MKTTFNEGDRVILTRDSTNGPTGEYGRKGDTGTVVQNLYGTSNVQVRVRFDKMFHGAHEWYAYVKELEHEYIERPYDPSQEPDDEDDV